MRNFTLRVFLGACILAITGITSAQDVIDLSGIDNANILVDTLPDVPNGAIVLLEPGMVYNAGGHAFDKSVTLKSNDAGNLMLPKIDCASNFNFGDGATVDSIVFMNIEFFGEYDARYVLNANVAATVGELKFDGCQIHLLRGMVRMKDNGPGTLDNLTIMNCQIDSIRDYGILTVDVNTWMCNNILIKNSTISKTRAFITNKNNSNSVVIDGCTLSEVTQAGQRMFRWRESGQDNVTGGIMIKNTLWGHGWDEENTGSTGIDGFDGLGETNWTFENTYSTNDLVFAEGKDTIWGVYDNIYGGTAAELWSDPYSGNFNYLDAAFGQLGRTGDPRWAVTTVDGGLEWNVSDTAMNALDELAETKTVTGLTIYAHSGKKVTIDTNGKTLDDMTFTHRLKLGGGGDFDDAGQPLGRVLSIDVMGNTNITVAAMSSSSGSDRILNIAAGSKDNIIAEVPALGASLTKGEVFYKGGPTKLYFYSPASGVNVYYIKAASVPTGIREINIERPEVNVYPNPADVRVFVDVNEPTQVGIYNIAGSLMKSKMVYSKSEAIDISELNQGIYIIRSQNNDSFVKKLIVQ